MKIAYLIAGAGGMYCGACIRDNASARALLEKGCDVTAIPLYTPIRVDGPVATVDRVLYGGVNVFLEQAGLGRWIPKSLARLLDSPMFLRGIGRLAAKIEPSSAGALTVSVLKGKNGRQRAELERLLDFLGEHVQPDVVYLPNCLFSALAGPIKEALGARVVCALQGEETFVDALPDPHRSEVRRLIQSLAPDIDAFTAPNRWYAHRMADFLGIDAAKIVVVPLGLDTTGYPERPASQPAEPTIGFMARVAPEKGLHVLCESFRRLCLRSGTENVRVKAAGWLAKGEREYLRRLELQMRDWGLQDRFSYIGELDLEAKVEFLSSLTVLSVPTAYPEPKGMYVLESMACGTPVVLPRHGSFPELIETAGGGVLVDPDDPDALADGLWSVVSDAKRRDELSRRGHEAVHCRLTSHAAADRLLKVFQV
jgi:glycosyltransferase involved in cell wall biosynthesis